MPRCRDRERASLCRGPNFFVVRRPAELRLASRIHPTALVSSDARLAPDVEVGPYAVIGPAVELASGCTVGAHAVIEGPSSFGEKNRIFPHAALGFAPQDLKYKNEPTSLNVGARNTFREFSTVHRGTPGGGGITTIGDDNFLMAYIHIAHDCHVGSRTIFANYAALAGHVEIADDAIVGAFCAIQQFSRVGRHAFMGAMTAASQERPSIRQDGRKRRCQNVRNQHARPQAEGFFR